MEAEARHQSPRLESAREAVVNASVASQKGRSVSGRLRAPLEALLQTRRWGYRGGGRRRSLRKFVA